MAPEITIRTSKEFKKLVDYIRARCIAAGSKCPTTSKITEMIAKNIDPEKVYQNEFSK